MINKTAKLEKVAAILVSLMILLQAFYGVFAYYDPILFATVRGTGLFAIADADWIAIYGSRTIFISLIIGYLLYSKHYVVLMWCALFGIVMPLTDGWLAYEAQAPNKVVLKHIATVLYLLVTFAVLKKLAGLKNV
ncbi:hypothetical protein PSECIP111951_02143 [Pseudoalteromonas holothuriae]|uniref:DUF4267 domain-containing protein n=1 Tax=Pseudoalteromonas holothuriae TaxID=2963714 RepID=A0A9W4VVN1_9GAMM|nr:MULTISPECIES: DUF4267 domain-containing protein [unclassified Pseudoalteromonas]CAH9050786.1 hypothetical protein PSECIP111854_00603 [Pseudoalteromonas sp. CIP111854]CAH9059800.1 hypothetical protein PSECIP111951_02143 [Pseudoalteromonas sp. CIP111951]